MQIQRKVVHDFDAHTRSDVYVYTLGMPKFVYVQVSGIEKPARIRADKAEETTFLHGQVSPDTLILKIGEEQVGKFKMAAVQGWWIEDEPEEKK